MRTKVFILQRYDRDEGTYSLVSAHNTLEGAKESTFLHPAGWVDSVDGGSHFPRAYQIDALALED